MYIYTVRPSAKFHDISVHSEHVFLAEGSLVPLVLMEYEILKRNMHYDLMHYEIVYSSYSFVWSPPCLRTEIHSNANPISARAQHPNSETRIKNTHEFAYNPTTSSPYNNITAQTLSINCAIILIYLFYLFMTRSALVSRLSSFTSNFL